MSAAPDGWDPLDLLWWSEQPDQPAPSGAIPVPAAALAGQVEQLYRPGATLHLQETVRTELRRRAAVREAAALFDSLPTTPGSDPRRPRASRTGTVALLTGVVLAAGVVLGVVPRAMVEQGPPSPGLLTPPPTRGHLLATATSWASTIDEARPLRVGADAVLRVTVACRGRGTLHASLAAGVDADFPCGSRTARTTAQAFAPPPAAFVYTVTAPPGVEWALSISSS